MKQNTKETPIDPKEIQKSVEEFLKTDEFKSMMEDTDLNEIVEEAVGGIEAEIVKESASNLQENNLLKTKLLAIMDTVQTYDAGNITAHAAFKELLDLIRPIIKGKENA